MIKVQIRQIRSSSHLHCVHTNTRSVVNNIFQNNKQFSFGQYTLYRQHKMTIQHLAANYLRKMKRTWLIRYEDELKSIAIVKMSIAADGGEAKSKNIFNSQQNAEKTMPFKKRLHSYRYEDFQPINEVKMEPTVVEKKNLRPRNSRSNSSDLEKPQFVPAPYEKPVTRRQTRKPATEQTQTTKPMPKNQTNGKRNRKPGKENQQNANNQTNKPNNCEPSTSKVEIHSPIVPSVNEPKEQHLPQQPEQVKQQQNELNTTAMALKGDDVIALLEMVAEKETAESQAIAEVVKSDDGPIDYSIKSKKETKIVIQKRRSPGTSNKRKRKSKPTKIEPMKIRLVSTSI